MLERREGVRESMAVAEERVDGNLLACRWRRGLRKVDTCEAKGQTSRQERVEINSLLRQPAPKLERLLADAPGIAELTEASDMPIELRDGS